ncbi:MAG: hypothetical protein LAN63_19175 [Acidobacteriia bacterium]|nr:hypothetical protein [Terriglobia bacterium]
MRYRRGALTTYHTAAIPCVSWTNQIVATLPIGPARCSLSDPVSTPYSRFNS